MNVIVTTILLGFVAAAAMAGFFWLYATLRKKSKEDLWIFGQLFFGERKRAKAMGLGAHLCVGAVMAMIYMLFWSEIQLTNAALYPVIGLGTGLVHGLLVGLTQNMIFNDADNQNDIWVTQALSHAVFGLVLGAGVGMVDHNFEFTEGYAQKISQLETISSR